MAQQKCHYQGEYQHQNCTVESLHDSDHDGVGRIFVRHSYHSNELFTVIIICAAQFFPYQECTNLAVTDRRTIILELGARDLSLC